MSALSKPRYGHSSNRLKITCTENGTENILNKTKLNFRAVTNATMTEKLNVWTATLYYVTPTNQIFHFKIRRAPADEWGTDMDVVTIDHPVRRQNINNGSILNRSFVFTARTILPIIMEVYNIHTLLYWGRRRSNVPSLWRKEDKWRRLIKMAKVSLRFLFVLVQEYEGAMSKTLILVAPVFRREQGRGDRAKSWQELA
jgi:hypothetical protein